MVKILKLGLPVGGSKVFLRPAHKMQNFVSVVDQIPPEGVYPSRIAFSASGLDIRWRRQWVSGAPVR